MQITSLVDLGLLIRKNRKDQGLTQKQAAGLCNVGVRFLSELENGKQTLQIGKVFNVIDAFGLEVEVYLRGNKHE